jgi:hypothetical protein
MGLIEVEARRVGDPRGFPPGVRLRDPNQAAAPDGSGHIHLGFW